MRGVTAWEECYREIISIIEHSRSLPLFFRGHCDADFQLEPGLARPGIHQMPTMESILYYDFITRAGDLLGSAVSRWDGLFAMQHAGVPTRLLDWSQTAGVALYFALKGATKDAALWILNPFQLNGVAGYGEFLPRPDELEGSYEDYFINHQKRFKPKVMALSPVRYSPRIGRQRAGFTLHRELGQPLENIYPKVVSKVLIPVEAQPDAMTFLRIAGISEFTLFPDLDGLARELRYEHLSPG